MTTPGCLVRFPPASGSLRCDRAYVEVGPVFIHAEACAGPSDPDELLNNRRVFRAYDSSGRIAGGKIVQPGDSDAAVHELFADESTVLIHVRAVEFGCFFFEIRR